MWVPLAYGFSQAHVAQLVRSAIDSAARNAELLQGAARQAQHIWYDRAFLLQHETRHECFLAAFPSLNSFSAQRILDGTTMRKFLSMPLERKLAKFPTIPAAMLQAVPSAWFTSRRTSKQPGKLDKKDRQRLDRMILQLEKNKHHKIKQQTEMLQGAPN